MQMLGIENVVELSCAPKRRNVYKAAFKRKDFIDARFTTSRQLFVSKPGVTSNL